MDNIKWGPDEDSAPFCALNSYWRCLGDQAANIVTVEMMWSHLYCLVHMEDRAEYQTSLLQVNNVQ